jgi:thioredoxin 1
MMGPVIEQLASEFAGKARVGKLNVDENPQTAASYGITAIPTLVIFNGGKAVDKMVGLQPKEVIASRLSAQIK